MDDFKKWQEIVEILAEDIRETKALTKETRELVIEARRSADAAEKNAEAAMKNAEAAAKSADAAVRKADAAWELVVITRNEVKERAERPWYKKLLGI